jgi:hypothetical protein
MNAPDVLERARSIGVWSDWVLLVQKEAKTSSRFRGPTRELRRSKLREQGAHQACERTQWFRKSKEYRRVAKLGALVQKEAKTNEPISRAYDRAKKE